LAAFCLPQPHGDPSQAPLVVLGLGVGAALLQATAAELPGSALFSSAPALTMAAALLGQAGAGLACVIAVCALFLRAFVLPRRNLAETLQQTLTDAIPELATISLIAMGAGWWGCLAYAPLAWVYPRLLGESPSSSLMGAFLGVACAGLLAGSLDLAANPFRLLPLVVVLAALQRLPAASGKSGRRWALRGFVQETRRKSKEQLTLEQLGRTLARCRTERECLDAILQVVAAVCPSRSQVIFLVQEGRLLPVRHQSPLQEKLDAYALLDQPEPVVEEAWRMRASLTFPPLPMARRLFEGESFGAALLLDPEGILYVGRAQPALSEEEVRLLELVAAQVMPALRAVRSQELERQAVEQYHREHRRLEEELARLQNLLAGTRQMVSTLDFMALEERLEGMLVASIPHQFGAILTVSEGKLYPRRQWGAQLDVGAAVAVSQAVLSNGLPLTLEGRSRLAPLVPTQAALVAAPMQLEHGATGVLILGTTAGSFEREHQDLLWMIGCLAAISFSNAGLHQEVISTQAQLLHAGKLAAIGQLAAGVAHELNTPLGAIRLNLDGLNRQLGEADQKLTRKLDRARMAAGHAHEIVEKLLVYCRDDRSEYQPVEIGQIVPQTLEMVQAQLQKDNVQIETDLTPVPKVLGSSLELRQVLTNLLMNARDAVLSPGALARNIVVRTRCQEDQVLLQVLDRGPGVPAEVGGRIFEPFFTTKPVGRGTGLGLSICHRIAAKHGGVLEYESPPGGGTVFTLRLPALT